MSPVAHNSPELLHNSFIIGVRRSYINNFRHSFPLFFRKRNYYSWTNKRRWLICHFLQWRPTSLKIIAFVKHTFNGLMFMQLKALKNAIMMSEYPSDVCNLFSLKVNKILLLFFHRTMAEVRLRWKSISWPSFSKSSSPFTCSHREKRSNVLENEKVEEENIKSFPEKV